MTGEAVDFGAQSYFDAIVNLGEVPVISDLTAANAFSLLQDQFNDILSTRPNGWETISLQNWAAGANQLLNPAAPTVFPLGSPVGAINDADTPDGTMFRFTAGGGGTIGAGNNFTTVGLRTVGSSVLIPTGYISNVTGSSADYFWNAEINGFVIGSSGARTITWTGRMCASAQNRVIGIMDLSAAANVGSGPTNIIDAFEIVADQVIGTVIDLRYAALEYKLP